MHALPEDIVTRHLRQQLQAMWAPADMKNYTRVPASARGNSSGSGMVVGAIERAQSSNAQEFANLMAELLAGRRGPEVQLEGVRMGVKVEKPESRDSSAKGCDLVPLDVSSQGNTSILIVIP